MKKPFLPVGRITTTHGVRGEVKIEHWCDDASDLKKINRLYLDENGTRPLDVKNIHEAGKWVLASFEGYGDMNAALALKMKTLYAARNDIPQEDGRVFIADLIGLPIVHDETDAVLGHITDVVNYGASDLYEIKTQSGKTALIPAIDAFIKKIDTEEAVRILPIPGLLDDEI